MRAVFSPNKPVISVNQLATQEEKDEQEGIMYFFVGGMLAFRNPPSHDDEKQVIKEDAFYAIAMANYLMCILDKHSN